jgi:twitching motility two-component system response regulator PilH
LEGYEFAKQHKPDIIMMDIILPQMDGFSALEKIKQDEETKNIKVIMLTNLGTEEDRAKGEKLGAAGYLVKARLTPAQVSAKIKEYLQ